MGYPVEDEITTLGFDLKATDAETLTPKDRCFGNIHSARKRLRKTTPETFSENKSGLEMLLEHAMSWHTRLIDRVDDIAHDRSNL